MSYENRVATAGNIINFRKPNQKSRIRFYIRKPSSVYTATLSAIPSTNDMITSISFTGGVGTLGDVRMNMTLLVGSSAGGHDLGFARIRKAPIAGTFYIGETSEINWSYAGTIYLTVVDDTMGVWPRHLVLISQIPYMDGDIAYSNQHTNFDPVVVMGTDRVALLTGASVSLNFDASTSWVYGSTITGYSWVAPGSSGSSGLSTATPTITYNAEGEYQVYCTVTAATGKTHTGARTIFVDAGTLGYKGQLVTNPIAEVGEGGWSCEVTVVGDLEGLMDFTKVIIATEDYYDNTKTSIGPISGSENIELIGWIIEESIEHDPKMQYTKFRVGTIDKMIKNIPGFIHGLENAPNAASAWTNIAGLTVDKSLWHLLHWRSTVDYNVDIILTNDTRYIKETTTPAGNLWQQFVQLLGPTIAANIVSDRYSRVIAQLEPQLVPVASRTWSTVRTLEAQDWYGQVTFQIQSTERTGRIYLDGLGFSAQGQGQAFFSLAPGHVPKRFGAFASIPSMLLSTQAQANALAGAVLAWHNNRYREITVDLLANDKFADIGPNMYYAGSFTDTRRNRVVTGNFIPRRVERVWSESNGSLTTSMSLELATSPDINTNGDIPDTADGGIPPVPNFPNLPPFPPIVIPPIPGEENVVSGPRQMVIATSNFGVLYTTNFNDDEPNWQFMGNGLTETERNSIYRIFYTKSGALFALGHDGTYDTVWWAPVLGGVWQKLFSANDFPAGGDIWAMGYNYGHNEQVAVFGGTNGTTTNYFYMGDRNGLTLKSSGLNSSFRTGGLVGGANNWLLIHARRNIFETQHWIRFNSDGTKAAEGDLPSGSNAAGVYGVARGGDSNNCIGWDTGASFGYWLTDDCATFTHPGSPDFGSSTPNGYQAGDGSPSGQRFMAGVPSVIMQRSYDAGATFGPVDPTLGVGYSVVVNCDSEDAFTVFTVQVAKYTPDFGSTWIDKSGDLANVAPLCAIQSAAFAGW